MRSLLPVSYPPKSNSDSEKGAESALISSEGDSNLERADDIAASSLSDIVGTAAFSSQNGTAQAAKDVSSLQLDPLPCSSPSPPQVPPKSEDPPDPSSLQLAPLPPLTDKDRQPFATSEPTRSSSTSEKEAKQSEDDANLNVQSPLLPPKVEEASVPLPLEVFNDDEFGVQEMSVFATSSSQRQEVSATLRSTSKEAGSNSLGSTPGKLISSARSAFRPVIVTPRDTASPVPTRSASLGRGDGKSADSVTNPTPTEQQPKCNKAEYVSVVRKTLSCLPDTAKTTSGMDSVTLGEFSEAFMKGDTTNWFQRMLLLDHIEAVQDKIRGWMQIIDEQLDGEQEKIYDLVCNYYRSNLQPKDL